MEKVLSILKNTKLLGVIGAILLIIGNFMNFAIAEIFGIEVSISLIDEEFECPWVLILGIISLILVFIDFIIVHLPEGKANFLKALRSPKLSIIPGIISAIIVFMKAAGDAEIFDSEYISAGLGFYVLLLGALSLVVYPFLYKGE